VQEAIRELLPLFNQKLHQDGSLIHFVEDSTMYKLYPAKKTGQPKSDYPALDAAQVLNQTGMQSFSLVEIDPKALKNMKKNLSSSKISEDFGASQRTPTKKQSSVLSSSSGGTNMVQPDMPKGGSQPHHLSMTQDGGPEVQTTCCCFTKTVVNKNNTVQEQLKQPLVDK